MNIIAIILLVVLIVGYAINYDKFSYKAMYKRQEINSKHPNWKPYCSINFLEEDPQWFRDNGYEEWVEDK